MLLRDPWRIAALALGAMVWWQWQRCRHEHRRATSVPAGGVVNLDPVLDHLECALDELAVAGGVRQTCSPDHCLDRPALRVLP